MNVMDMFRSAVGMPSQVPAGIANQQPGATPGTPGNLPANQPQMTANSPDGQLPGNLPAKEESPMKDFMTLFDTPKLADGEIPDGPIQFKIDAGKVQQSAKQIDFTKTITPALLEKIKAGGEGAQQAMLQAMNEMSQNVFANVMMANTKVLESGLESSHQRVTRNLSGEIKKVTVGNALREDNPLFSNPATAPMLQMLENQLLVQFPNASVAEIKEHARKYMSGFAAEIAKGEPTAQDKLASVRGREIDWSTIPV